MKNVGVYFETQCIIQQFASSPEEQSNFSNFQQEIYNAYLRAMTHTIYSEDAGFLHFWRRRISVVTSVMYII